MNTSRERRGTRPMAVLLSAAVLTLQAVIAPAPAVASTGSAATPQGCVQGTLPHGAQSLICLPPSGWNGAVVVWAHGYIASNRPLDFYDLALGDVSLPDLAASLGFAFATTSYRQNGLAILEGVDDVAELIAAFHASTGQLPLPVYVVGGSEGGIVTTLLAERRPDLMVGALALCGPIGDFTAQIDYDGDFRVLFDYFFPGILPGTPTVIPPELIAGWDSIYVPRIRAAVTAAPLAAFQLIRTSRAAVIPGDASSLLNTTLALLWYSVFATNDAAAKLGGNPFSNIGRWYTGSFNDLRLNFHIERVARSPTAGAAMAAYQTSGSPRVPLVTMHTTGDPVIPFWHEIVYSIKARGHVPQIPVERYGHCTFTVGEVLGAFSLLLQLAAAPR